MSRRSERIQPFTETERAFLLAIDRIVAGKPTADAFGEGLSKGVKPPVNMTNVAVEAGYARTYLYKNREPMARVFARLEEVLNPQVGSITSVDVQRKLRLANTRLKQERDLAIDATRRCMQEVTRLQSENDRLKKGRADEVVKLKARISTLEAEAREFGGKGNIVNFPS